MRVVNAGGTGCGDEGDEGGEEGECEDRWEEEVHCP